MSDQSKPTGEWTAEHDNMIYADGVFVTLIKDDGDRGRVVQMHNAAIAAVWKHADTIAKLADDQVESFNATCDQLREQLAAERSKRELAEFQWKEVSKQLAALRGQGTPHEWTDAEISSYVPSNSKKGNKKCG